LKVFVERHMDLPAKLCAVPAATWLTWTYIHLKFSFKEKERNERAKQRGKN
jgi:hypothetical protein